MIYFHALQDALQYFKHSNLPQYCNQAVVGADDCSTDSSDTKNKNSNNQGYLKCFVKKARGLTFGVSYKLDVTTDFEHFWLVGSIVDQ